jgi:protein-tyrosine phosphatase
VNAFDGFVSREPSRPFQSPEFQYSVIYPGELWLGEAPRDEDIEILHALGITDIINLTSRPDVLERERAAGFTVHHFPFPDGGFAHSNTAAADRVHAFQMITGAAERLDELVGTGARIYQHCVAGISRGPTVLLYWLLGTGQHDSYHSALESVQQARPFVFPDPDLVDILRELCPEAFDY